LWKCQILAPRQPIMMSISWDCSFHWCVLIINIINIVNCCYSCICMLILSHFLSQGTPPGRGRTPTQFVAADASAPTSCDAGLVQLVRASYGEIFMLWSKLILILSHESTVPFWSFLPCRECHENIVCRIWRWLETNIFTDILLKLNCFFLSQYYQLLTSSIPYSIYLFIYLSIS